MNKIILVAHNIRSCHNVGSLFRTAEGLGIDKIWLTGYTPYPIAVNDTRLPHLAKNIDSKIRKTALGAEKLIAWEQTQNILKLISQLKQNGFVVSALEQAPKAVMLSSYIPPDKQALVVGNEISGIEKRVLIKCTNILFIPMKGKKESFNVVQAAAMALYHFTNAFAP